MAKYRPTGVLVIAILHLIGGTLGLLSVACGGAFQLAGGQKMLQGLGGPQAAQQQQMQERMEKFIAERLPAQKAVEVAQFGGGAILGVMMISAGIGLIQMRLWARTLSIVYAVLSIVNRLLQAGYALFFSMPALKEFFAEEGKKDPAMAMASSFMGPASAFGVFITLLFIAYPIAVLVVMLKPSTAAAFRGEYVDPFAPSRRRPTPDDYDEPFRRDEPDDRYRSDR